MTDDRLTDRLTRAVDEAVELVRVPPAPVVPLRRRASWLAPLAVAAVVAACAAVAAALPAPFLQEPSDIAASAPASSPATQPPSRQGFDAEQEAMCPGAFAGDRSGTPNGLPTTDQQDFSVRSAEQVTIDWNSNTKGSQVSLVRVDVQPPVVLARSSATGLNEFTLRPEDSMRVELQGTSPSGYLCRAIEYQIKVDGRPLPRSYSTRSLPLVTMRLEAMQGRHLTVTGEITHHTDQTIGLYIVKGWGTGGEVTYTHLGDVALQSDGTFRAEHEFAAPGDYLVAARTTRTATYEGHMTEPLRVTAR